MRVGKIGVPDTSLKTMGYAPSAVIGTHFIPRWAIFQKWIRLALFLFVGFLVFW